MGNKMSLSKKLQKNKNGTDDKPLPEKYILTLAYIRTLEREYKLIVNIPLEIMDIIHSYHRYGPTFVPLLNVIQQVQLPIDYQSTFFNKCSVNPELGLLGIEGKKWFGCVDMNTHKVMFHQNTHSGYSRNTHHWFTKNGNEYLSLQTALNTIKIFEVSSDYKFKEDESFRLTVGSYDVIDFCEFDRSFDNILIVYNQLVLQKRSMNNVNEVLVNIELDETLDDAAVKQLSLCDDGSLCGIAGGYNKPYFYLIDIANNKTNKFESTVLTQTYCPSFINGRTEYVSIGGHSRLEIWDIAKQTSFKDISMENGGYISTSASVNDILAIGSYDQMLRLIDVRSWETFYTQKLELKPLSLHFSADFKYLTIAGGDGLEKCTVLQIQ